MRFFCYLISTLILFSAAPGLSISPGVQFSSELAKVVGLSDARTKLEQQQFSQVYEYLKGLKKIRVLFDKSIGYGHQAASLLVMRRLRELGYVGELQVVYYASQQDKMATLFPGFDFDGPVSFITIEEMARRDGWVDLGITGGFGPQVIPERFKIKTFLELSPKNWGLKTVQTLDIKSSKVRYRVHYLNSLSSMDFLYHLPQVNDADWFIETQLISSPHVAKSSGLAALLGSDRENFDFLAVYGLYSHLHNPAKLVMNLIDGISKAKELRPNLFKKPVIIGVLTALDDWTLSQLAAGIQGLHSSHVAVDLIDIQDFEKVSSKIRLQDDKRFLILKIGEVPQGVFEQIFGFSTLPALAAGRQTINLARMLDKAVIPTYVEPALLLDFKGSRQDEVYRLNGALLTGDSEALARYMIDQREAVSGTTQGLNLGNQSSFNLANDLVFQGLLEVMDILGGHRTGFCPRSFSEAGHLESNVD